MKNIFYFFCLLWAVQANAHAIWIETNPQAKLGDLHEVRVFFGEPNQMDTPTPTENWYSDLSSLRLSLTSPSGKTIELEKKQAENYYYAHFKVEENGVYSLSINHLVEKVYKRMRLRYQSVAFVSTLNHNEYVVLGDKKFFQLGVNTNLEGNEQVYHSFYKNRAFKNEKIVFDFNKEKMLKEVSDKKGVVRFSDDSKQKYIVNLAKQKKNKGTHNDRKHLFDYIWLTFFYPNGENVNITK
ncbi:MAG: hypothetical protein Q3983_00450 [Capnocytophaga sp.]|nr:hypothetical protein [Capnocytophaga sp.]